MDTDTKTAQCLTACKKGSYPWVPANCQEVDGEWYFLIQWRDCKGGWNGKAQCGTMLFCDFNNQCSVVSKPEKKPYGEKIKAEIAKNPSLNRGFKPWEEKKKRFARKAVE
jgi:hypothetical protein